MNFKQTKAIIGVLIVLLLVSMMIPSINAFGDNKLRLKSILLQSAEETYRERLGILEAVKIESNSVNKLIERKNIDEDNFNNIITISKLSIKPENKELIANDLLDMNKLFIKKLATRASLNVQNAESIKNQVTKYIQSKEKASIGITLDNSLIKDLFSKKITSNDFIVKILSK